MMAPKISYFSIYYNSFQNEISYLITTSPPFSPTFTSASSFTFPPQSSCQFLLNKLKGKIGAYHSNNKGQYGA